MKNLSFLLLIALSSSAFGQNDYHKTIITERTEKLEQLLDTTYHMLSTEDLEHFVKTDYFPVNEVFIIEGDWKKSKGRRFKMPTSTVRKPVYRRYGYVTFNMNGKKQVLTVFQNMKLRKKDGYENHLFLPFLDATAPDKSYGGGRYLDLRIPSGDKMILDFNLAYNPYCAYSYRYSCPIPPKENTIDTPIMAGEKKPVYHPVK
jgi:uncharacterized protein (DUF1684 family)